MTQTQTTPRISWALGFTRNLGNFESLRADFSVEDSVREGETIDQASERVFLKVQSELVKKVNEFDKQLRERKARD